ncbi:putative membrane protein [Modicisalibacter ilicicola DSM 19980]|uniref:Putative membrane protein n=1 Tax=Modicisalibacter ilicicola DSM 19980 TaxID=1121942 RepID=A0A1M5DLQ7_9GAMM|nr:SHOCT domain-containing protein [Halomonas ilicicola]SHF67890.1 putative membrane protein [Halomonas ilicicola DSM 19980]
MKRLWLTIGSVLLGLSAAFPALAQQRYDDSFWHPAWGWGHMFFGGLMMIVFWGGIIALVVLLVRWLSRNDALGRSDTSDSGSSRRPTPLEILQERYARGEIDKQEYEERRKDLSR